MYGLSESCFAKSRYLEFMHQGKALGFVLASVLFKQYEARSDFPKDNPVVQELLYAYKQKGTYCWRAPNESDEEECLEYIKTRIKWSHFEWFFQPRHRTYSGIVKQLLKADEVSFKFAEEEPPQRLYKYTASKNVSHFIEESSIYLSAPTKFNDPFDCPFSGPARERMDKMGISCFSTVNKNSVMFSHYADKHQGVCLIFDPEYFRDLWNRWDNNVTGRIQRVTYYDRFPCYDEETEPALIATAKYRDWSYEREYRLTTSFGFPEGLYKFKPEALIGVIFGVRMPGEEKEKIFRMTVNHGRTLDFYQAKKRQNSYSLNVRRVDFDTSRLEWIDK